MQAQLIFFAILLASSPILAQGIIDGIVVDGADQTPLPGANLRLFHQPLGAVTGADGRFSIKSVPSGSYRIEASYLGYRTAQDTVTVADGATVQIRFTLEPDAISLREIVVTPGHFSIMRNDPTVKQTLSRDDIQSIPQLGEDVYRAVTRIPGISGNDFSAKFTVRGGEHDQVLVRLDGLELYEPFHMKDIGGGTISIVDVMAIGGIDLLTGGFPAEYGNRLSGVFDIESARPAQQGRTSLGISFANARFMNEGQFADGRGAWFVSARRGYIDLILKMMGEENISPDYYDLLGKVHYRLSQDHKLSAHILRAGDHFDVTEDGDEVDSNYGNTYLWTKLNSTLRPGLVSQTLFGGGRVSSQRRGLDLDQGDEFRFSVADKRHFDVFTLKQDWLAQRSESQLFKWGFELKQLQSDYTYFSRDRFFTQQPDGSFAASYDTTQVALAPEGRTLGLYTSGRLRLKPRLTAEAGLRFDMATHTEDRDWSPRLNLVYALGKTTVLRGGWGRFYQYQGVDELDVAYNLEDFYPSQQADHWVLGGEHRLGDLDLRLEFYRKDLSRIRPRFESVSTDVLFFPELEEDYTFFAPSKGTSQGLEFYFKRDKGGRFTWWGSYALARSVERANNRDVPTNADQRHTFYLDFNYRPSPKWRLNLAWQFRSGWPYTATQFTLMEEGNRRFVDTTYGPPNGKRFPAFHRLDMRLNRFFNLGAGKKLSLFLEVVNLYNRDNVRVYFYNLDLDENDQLLVRRDPDHWFPILPSIGASWEF